MQADASDHLGPAPPTKEAAQRPTHTDAVNGFPPQAAWHSPSASTIVVTVASDAVIALAYFAIFSFMMYMARRRPDLAFGRVLWTLGTFVVVSGLVRLIEIITVWQPWHWLSALARAIVALASIAAAVVLAPLLPQILTIRSPLELDRVNHDLEAALQEKDRLLALYEREHRVAGELQRAFLPVKLPEMPGISFDAAYQAGVAESDIGGDWYDAFSLADGRIAISIGDVAGRGLHAAVTMGKVRQSFRVCSLQQFDTAKTVQFAERMLELYDPGAMVTAFFAVFHPITRELSYTNAGHPPPIALSPDGDVTLLKGTSVPLGVAAHIPPVVRTITLEPGSILVLYTDGLIESRHDIVNDTQALLSTVRRIAVEAPRHPAEAIRAAMLDGPAKDDVAILVLSVHANAAEPIDITLPAVPESLRAARVSLRRFAFAAGCSDDRARALEIAAGEAITNVIEHAYGIAQGTVRIKARVVGDAIEVDVEDTGAWRAPRQEGRGRGIAMMKLLTTEFRLEQQMTGKRVHFVMPIADPQWAREGTNA